MANRKVEELKKIDLGKLQNEIIILLKDKPIKGCEKIDSGRFTWLKKIDSYYGYMDFLAFVKNKNSNLAEIEIIKYDGYFRQVEIDYNLLNCDEENFQKNKIKYVDQLEQNKCKLVQKLEHIWKRSYDRPASNKVAEVWTKLELEKIARELNIDT